MVFIRQSAFDRFQRRKISSWTIKYNEPHTIYLGMDANTTFKCYYIMIIIRHDKW